MVQDIQTAIYSCLPPLSRPRMVFSLNRLALMDFLAFLHLPCCRPFPFIRSLPSTTAFNSALYQFLVPDNQVVAFILPRENLQNITPSVSQSGSFPPKPVLLLFFVVPAPSSSSRPKFPSFMPLPPPSLAFHCDRENRFYPPPPP